MRRFTIDGTGVTSFSDFVAAANAGLVRPAGGEWNGNLDAFNDYLAWPSEPQYEIEILGSWKCRQALGHEAMAAWLRDNLTQCHLTGLPSVKRRLAAAERREGQTLFGLLKEIIEGPDNVTLTLR
jgi:hypothetical protein